MNGCFITLEGPEGGGKSTQIARLKRYLEQQGVPYTATREPGGTSIGDQIRQLLLDPANDFVHWTEVLLYAASRAQLVDQVIRPALLRGEVVLCDRFVDSSIAYQAYGAARDLDKVVQINKIATGGLKPTRTYLLDLPVSLGIERLAGRERNPDRIEQKSRSYHERVRQGYLTLAQSEPERIMIIDASQSESDIFTAIQEDLRRLLQNMQNRRETR